MKNSGLYIYLCIALCLMCLNSAYAATINVPADEPTIQSGIDLAQDGDTVLVAAGTYKGEGNVNIDFLGKEIIVKSASGALSTIVDCFKTPETRGFIFQNRETNKSILEGFTIKNGRHGFGGGIHIYDASPTIKNCVITENESTDRLFHTDGGGGIYLFNADAIILDCRVSKNDGTGILIAGLWDKDGTVLRETQAEPSILNSTILANKGEGIFCTEFVNPLITKCIVTQNQERGIEYNYHARTETPITNCLITQNTGGGVGIREYSSLSITNSIIKDNEADEGGGIYCSPTSVLIASDCIIAGNIATEMGGGIAVIFTRGGAKISNCTITRNTATVKAGGVLIEGGGVELSTSIVWGNESHGSHDEISVVPIYSGTIIKSCDIRKGLEGIGREPDSRWFIYESNIDEDPLFMDADNGDYSLKLNSPALGMGANVTEVGVTSVNSVGKRLVSWGELKRR